MNLSKNIKKALKIEKKVLFKKIFKKIISTFTSKLSEAKDRKNSTYILWSDLEFMPLKISLNSCLEPESDFIDNLLHNKINVFGHTVDLVSQAKSLPFPSKSLYQSLNLLYENTDTIIDWDTDYISGNRWNSHAWYKNIKYGKDDGADIKVPWEIGRLQFLLPLAIHGFNNNSFEEQNKVKRYLLDFIIANPPRFGTQWMTSMDVAIRAINLILVLSFYKQNGVQLLNADEQDIVYSYILQHGLHIESNLEFSQGMRGNHYFANIIGVLSCAFFFNQYPNKENTIVKYINELLNEVDYQFNKDNLNFEASIPYHFFVLEMLNFAIQLFSNYQEQISNKIMIKVQYIEKAYNNILKASQKILLTGNYIPQIGDNDGGYLYNILPTCEIDRIKQHIIQRVGLETETTQFEHFNDSGIYINKTSCYDFVMRCGKIGQNGKGGHDHNDHTSFELLVEGIPFIVDAGTYNYTAYHSERNKFRSSFLHNTFIIKGEEQNLFDTGCKDDLFWLSEVRTNSKLIEANSKHVTATHGAFNSLCMRKISFAENSISCSDTIEKSGCKSLRFFLAPGVEINRTDAHYYLTHKDKTIIIKCINSGKIQAYQYSKSYLQKENALYIEFETHEKNIEWKIEL